MSQEISNHVRRGRRQAAKKDDPLAEPPKRPPRLVPRQAGAVPRTLPRAMDSLESVRYAPRRPMPTSSSTLARAPSLISAQSSVSSLRRRFEATSLDSPKCKPRSLLSTTASDKFPAIMSRSSAGRARSPSPELFVLPALTPSQSRPVELGQLLARPKFHARSKGVTPRGLVGLKNLYNTCYMNSILQCLLASELLVGYIESRDFAVQMSKASASMGRVAAGFGELLQRFMRLRTGAVLDPGRFKTTIDDWNPMFRGDSQHDAQEFLRSLLEGLHQDLNRIQERPAFAYTAEEFDKLCDADKARVSWNRYHASNDSAIADLFVGQLCSILECQKCRHTSSSYEEFWDLSLPVPEGLGETYKTIEQCVKEFAKEELLEGYKCTECRSTESTTKRLQIVREPKLLVIHVKRFATNGAGFCTKIRDDIACQLHNFSLNSAGAGARYDLFAACTHRGGFGGGHYIANIKNPDSGEWHEMDDETVSRPLTRPSVAGAYLLFYVKR
ncbi:Ubiquitin carboxyl-terminal hydrolase 21 [Geranomyces variabilis]|uniref:Ubiquitin carboxyl-terminal hydrolase 21 n=1 Tax=Geranomyces variabilis TaxID=109894 RepID=A0AAD5XLA5_9FUNG|nr:Ubiquitin carboxyl-terminal hydrolase 21 [Geranomyces variabilis]